MSRETRMVWWEWSPEYKGAVMGKVAAVYWPTQTWRQFNVHFTDCCWLSVTIGRFSLDIVR